ncbi:hypothetical protein D0C36_15810 [Mucilaginibacter conchicola]|uniref:DUF4468 domain-containing protein n=1 Tax=Mucilaginibacter conchicola TaxID=2303333 RepID=A0A372NUE4_9SPHI|nr:hypothetical protein [Mucilaginibacter conchicola]RFZ92856.1 hypothetical protein D0C36_15810 [Mucilaginibacter conchicola]
MKRYLIILKDFMRLAVLFAGLLTGGTFCAFAQEEPGPPQDTATHFLKTPLVKLVVRNDSAYRDSVQLLVQGIKQGRARLLTFLVQNVIGGEFAVKAGQRAFIYIEDGTTVQLNAEQTVYSKFGGLGYANYVTPDYALSLYDLDPFKNYNVGNIRIEYSEGVFSFELSAEASAALKELLESLR